MTREERIAKLRTLLTGEQPALPAPKVKTGRRESRRPLYALRPEVDGKQVYALSKRGYVVKVKDAEAAAKAAQA